MTKLIDERTGHAADLRPCETYRCADRRGADDAWRSRSEIAENVRAGDDALRRHDGARGEGHCGELWVKVNGGEGERGRREERERGEEERGGAYLLVECTSVTTGHLRPMHRRPWSAWRTRWWIRGRHPWRAQRRSLVLREWTQHRRV